MRSLGFVLILVGGLIAYLGYQGRVGLAWEALRTGQVPNLSGNTQLSGAGGGADNPAGGGVAV